MALEDSYKIASDAGVAAIEKRLAALGINEDEHQQMWMDVRNSCAQSLASNIRLAEATGDEKKLVKGFIELRDKQVESFADFDAKTISTLDTQKNYDLSIRLKEHIYQIAARAALNSLVYEKIMETVNKQIDDWGFETDHIAARSHFGKNGSYLVFLKYNRDNINGVKELLKEIPQTDMTFLTPKFAKNVGDAKEKDQGTQDNQNFYAACTQEQNLAIMHSLQRVACRTAIDFIERDTKRENER